MLRTVTICLIAAGFAGESRADLLYTFTYTAVSGPVHSFSFNFEPPDFVTDGSSPSFIPFTPTDGANNWTFTKDLVSAVDPSGLNIGCFVFGTPFAGVGGPPPFFGPCSVSVGGPGVSQAGLIFETNGGLPSAPGIYAARYFIGIFDTAAGFEYIGPVTSPSYPTGSMSLSVTGSAVPEPATISTGMFGILVLTPVILRRRRASTDRAGHLERAG